jgi:hypothetical protein
MRTVYRRLAVALVVVAPLVTSQAGLAQQAPSGAGAKAADDAWTKKARELFNEGVKAYNESKWEDAHALFTAAWSLKKHWQIAANLGDCEMHLGRYREAADHLAYYAREAPEEKRAQAREFLKKAQEKIGTVTVTVDRPEADVLVDGARVGTTPLSAPLFIEPGARTITARVAGLPVAKKLLVVAPGSTHEVALKLEAEKKKEAAPKPGPVEPVAPRGSSPVPWVIGGAALAAVGIGMGIGFTVAANGKSDEAAALVEEKLGGDPTACYGKPVVGDCMAARDAVASQATFARAAAATYVIGVAAAGATFAAYMLWPKPKVGQPRSGRITPWVTPQSAGIAGTF